MHVGYVGADISDNIKMYEGTHVPYSLCQPHAFTFFVLSFLFGSLMFLMLDLTKCTYFLVVPDREKIQYLGSCTIVIDAMAEGLVFIFTSSFSCYFFLIYEMVQTLLAA